MDSIIVSVRFRNKFSNNTNYDIIYRGNNRSIANKIKLDYENKLRSLRYSISECYVNNNKDHSTYVRGNDIVDIVINTIG